jgi:hypothetical protein
MVNSPGTQQIEYVPAQSLPTGTDVAVYKDRVCKIIVMKAVADYHFDNREFEEESRLGARIEKKMAELRA